jgi:hypothetical protein
VKNKASAKKLQKAEKRAEMANYQIKLNFGKIAELTKEMALLKEQQQLKQQVKKKLNSIHIKRISGSTNKVAI